MRALRGLCLPKVKRRISLKRGKGWRGNVACPKRRAREREQRKRAKKTWIFGHLRILASGSPRPRPTRPATRRSPANYRASGRKPACSQHSSEPNVGANCRAETIGRNPSSSPQGPSKRVAASRADRVSGRSTADRILRYHDTPKQPDSSIRPSCGRHSSCSRSKAPLRFCAGLQSLPGKAGRRSKRPDRRENQNRCADQGARRRRPRLQRGKRPAPNCPRRKVVRDRRSRRSRSRQGHALMPSKHRPRAFKPDSLLGYNPRTESLQCLSPTFR
jgi:hypothetical protein